MSSELTPTLPSRRKLTGPMSTPFQREASPAAGMRTSLLGANAKSGGEVAGAQGPGSTANGAGWANHSQAQEPAPIDDVRPVTVYKAPSPGLLSNSLQQPTNEDATPIQRGLAEHIGFAF